MPKNVIKNYIGIDVSKKNLDICLRPSMETFRVTNDQDGFKELKKRLKAPKSSLIALEATGGYESDVVSFLQGKNFNVAVVNPRQVRDFGKSSGKLAKTDRIDAHTIAHFAEVFKPRVKEKASEKELKLGQNQQRRKQLVDMITMEKNRLYQAKGSVKTVIQETIEFLQKQLKKIEAEQEQQISKNTEWSTKCELLCSVKGIGQVTATTLIAGLPELGNIDDKELAALVGVAPLNRDSGDHQGTRGIWGGRADIRTAMYMATLVAVRFNPPLKKVYERLCQNGKKKKVALIACLRKLLIILNAMMRNGTVWSPKLIEETSIHA